MAIHLTIRIMRINIVGTDTSEKPSKVQKSGDPPSSKNCISDHNGFCKTHRRLGKMVDVTKKDMKLDENSKKFEVKLSTIQEFTCIDKTDVTKKDIYGPIC